MNTHLAKIISKLEEKKENLPINWLFLGELEVYSIVTSGAPAAVCFARSVLWDAQSLECTCISLETMLQQSEHTNNGKENTPQ